MKEYRVCNYISILDKSWHFIYYSISMKRKPVVC